MTLRKLTLSCLTFTFLTFIPDNTLAQDVKNDAAAMLVLDASGSMWGKIGDKHKIEIARDVVGETVINWDKNTKLGLIAYGHNHKGDCGDIEVLMEPSTVNAETFKTKTGDLNPKGKTPLTAAVIKAAETLKYREAKATVILISDGKETCDLDPCEIGRKLEETGVDFTAHIIGFDVPKAETAGLQCLADMTGGMFIEAKNASDLMEAMNNTREVITDKTAPKLDEAILKVPSEVAAGSVFEVEWEGPKNPRDYLIIRSPDRKKRFNTAWIGSDHVNSPTKMTAPEDPGTYTVFYEVNKNTPLGSVKLVVTPVTATLKAPDAVPAGSEFKVEWTGPDNKFQTIRIFSEDGEKKYASAYAFEDDYPSPAQFTAPKEPGVYELRFLTHGKKTLAKRKLIVE